MDSGPYLGQRIIILNIIVLNVCIYAKGSFALERHTGISDISIEKMSERTKERLLTPEMSDFCK